MPATVLQHAVPLPNPVIAPVHLVAAGLLTRRGAERVLRVAWTLAVLEQPGPDQIAEALAFRDRPPG